MDKALEMTKRSWHHMWYRCYKPKTTGYCHYGGRGIRIDPRWIHFENFVEDMGLRPEGLTLERINNNADYSKSNCTWADRVTQARNRRPKASTRAFEIHLKDLLEPK